MIRRTIVSLALVVATGTMHARAQSFDLPVVPLPQVVTEADGAFALQPGETTIRLAMTDTAGIMLAVADLQETFDQAAGGRPALDVRAEREIVLGLPLEDEAFARVARQARIWPDDRLGPEGYAMVIESERVLVAANEVTGLFYGVQTLRQLVRALGPEGRLPALQIADWPDLEWRGLMDDVSRGPLPTLAYMKEQVRRLAELKMNLFTHYVEHVVATERRGDFAPPEALSIDEWRELSEYARRHHMTVVGSFQSFGHFQQILSHPQYANLGEGRSLLSPALTESYELLSDVYDELVPAFDAPFFIVHADETFDLGRGASKPLVDSLGAGVVYARHVNRLRELLQTHDVRMMIWGDILLNHPEVIPTIPEDVIIGTWEYSTRDSFDDIIVPFKDSGHEFIVTPGVLNSSRIMPDFREAVANIATFIRDGVEHGARGMLLTVWDDGGSALFDRDWYGVAYGADQSWNSSPDDASFPERFGPAFYGDHGHAATRAIAVLNTLADLAPTDAMNEQVFWTSLVPERGQSVQINLQDWDQVLAAADSAEAAVKEASPVVRGEDLEVFTFTADQYRYMAANRIDLLAAADAYRAASFLQTEEREAAREALLAALYRVGDSSVRLLRLRRDFRTRWLRENRTYALDRVLEKYDAHIRALEDVEAKLMQALQDFDRGFFLPPPNQVRLDIEETSGWFFREWMMSGPIEAGGTPGDLRIDYLEAMGGEENARPQVTQEFEYGGETYRWHRLASPQFAVVDLASHYARNTDVVLYAHAMIDSPAAERVRALVGSNDGVEVFVNGRRIHANPVIRTLTIDEDEIWLPLEAGRNHLLLKVGQDSGDWGFTFRLPDKEIRNRKNRYRIIG